jgi:hypothetical protein
MQLKQLINRMPVLICVPILQSGLIFCIMIVAGWDVLRDKDFIFHAKIWIITLPVWLVTVLYVVIRSAIDIRALGLKYSATFGEVGEAKKRRDPGRPSR